MSVSAVTYQQQDYSQPLPKVTTTTAVAPAGGDNPGDGKGVSFAPGDVVSLTTAGQEDPIGKLYDQWANIINSSTTTEAQKIAAYTSQQDTLIANDVEGGSSSTSNVDEVKFYTSIENSSFNKEVESVANQLTAVGNAYGRTHDNPSFDPSTWSSLVDSYANSLTGSQKAIAESIVSTAQEDCALLNAKFATLATGQSPGSGADDIAVTVPATTTNVSAGLSDSQFATAVADVGNTVANDILRLLSSDQNASDPTQPGKRATSQAVNLAV